MSPHSAMWVANEADATEDVRTTLFSTAGPDVIAEERLAEVAKVEGTAPYVAMHPSFAWEWTEIWKVPFS